MLSKYALPLLILAFSTSAISQEATGLPTAIRDQYVLQVDPSISDEFNSGKLDTKKWGRRNTGGPSVTDNAGDESLVVMEADASNPKSVAKYVSFKATAPDGVPKTAGIVSRATGYFGFYVLRFRYRGLDAPDVAKNKTIWHPAVWAGILDNTEGVKRSSVNGARFWLEIDFMEWHTYPHGWKSGTVARLVDSTGKKRMVTTKGPDAEWALMKDIVKIRDDRWQTIGMEYSPKHLKLWQWKDGGWKNFGDREVKFVKDDLQKPESKYTHSTIGKRSAQPCFWLLGNVVSRYLIPRIENGTVTHTMEDMSFDIDFFRYHRHKSVKDADWLWENQLPKGG